MTLKKGDVVDIRLKSGGHYSGVQVADVDKQRVFFFKDCLSAPTIVQIADIAYIQRCEF